MGVSREGGKVPRTDVACVQADSFERDFHSNGPFLPTKSRNFANVTTNESATLKEMENT